jgi:hypothetical protein
MLSLRNPFLPRFAPLLFVALIGCSDTGPKIVKVNGTLTYKGKPVPGAIIQFVPADGAGRPSTGQTDAQGRFKLIYDRQHDGAAIGKYKVWVSTRAARHAEDAAAMLGKKAPTPNEMAEFIDKYSAEKSKVEVAIDKSTTDLKLNWD